MSKKLFALCMAAGLLGLASCNNPTTSSEASVASSEDEFQQNSESFAPLKATMYIIGSGWNNWKADTIATANPSCAFTPYEGSTTKLEYTATVTHEMASDWVGFKFIESNSWNVQYGMEDVDLDSCNDAFKNLYAGKTKADFTEGASNRTNILNGQNAAFEGTYHIVYDMLDFRSNDNGGTYHFVIDFTPAVTSTAA